MRRRLPGFDAAAIFRFIPWFLPERGKLARGARTAGTPYKLSAWLPVRFRVSGQPNGPFFDLSVKSMPVRLAKVWGKHVRVSGHDGLLLPELRRGASIKSSARE